MLILTKENTKHAHTFSETHFSSKKQMVSTLTNDARHPNEIPPTQLSVTGDLGNALAASCLKKVFSLKMCPCLVLADQNKVISDFDVLVRFQSAVCSLCVQRILAEGGVDTGDLIVPQTLSPCRCQPAVLTALMVHRTVDETNSQHTMQSIQPYSCTTHLISHQHSGVSSREIVLC